MGTATLPKTLNHHTGGGCALLLGFPLLMVLLGVGVYLTKEQGLSPVLVGGVGGAVALGLSAWGYYFFSSDVVVEVDREGMRVTRASRLGPIRGRAEVLHDVKWSALSVIEEVTSHHRTRHGDVQQKLTLRLGREEFSPALLGTAQRNGKYAELLDAIRAAVGDRLVAREDLGELDATVRKVAGEEAARRAKR